MSYIFINILNAITNCFLTGNFYVSIINSKYSRKKSITILTTMVLLLYLIETQVVIYMNISSYKALFFKTIINALACFLCAKCISMDNLKRNIINFFIWLFMLLSCELILDFIFLTIYKELPNAFIDNGTMLLWSLMANCIYFCLSTIAIIFIDIKRNKIKEKFIYYLSIFPLIQVVLMTALLISYVNRVNSQILLFGEFCLISFIIADYVVYTVLKENINNFKLKRTIDFMKIKSKSEYEYYKLSLEKNEEIRRIKHDVNNQLQSMYILFSSKNQEKIDTGLSMLNELENKINEVSSVYYCDNPIINTVLALKSSLAKKKFIKLNMDICSINDINIGDMDLCNLFSNLYDNAIESCEKVAFDKRFINIKVKRKTGFLVIKFDNPMKDNLDFDINNIKSSKEDVQNHGLGLKSIESIVDTYGGKMNITTIENKFQISIIFQ